MVDFSLTEEQQALVTLTRDFVEREVKPISLERDQRTDPAACFPWDIVDKASAAGLRTLPLAKEYGGAGADSVTIALLVEELSVGDLGVSVIFAQTWKFVQMIQDSGSEAQRQKFLIPFRDDPRGLIAVGMTEPEGGGSDHLLPFLDPKAGAKLSAVRDGDYVVLNGMKHFISLGNTAKLYIIFARTDATKPITEGLSAFLVTAGTPGFTIGRVHDKMGERLCNNAELIFQNCRVPLADMFGSWNTALADLAKLLRQSNAYAGASALGVGRAAYEKALAWSKQRTQGGTLIIDHQAIALKLADMWVRIQAAHYLIMRAAWAADHPEYFDPRWARASKVFASQVAMDVALNALQVHGGYGIMREVGMEKLVRDACVFLHSDGTNDVLSLGIANFIKAEP